MFGKNAVNRLSNYIFHMSVTNKKLGNNKQLEKYRASIKARHALRQWYQTPLGEAVEKQECMAMEELLPSLFGYHLVQLSEHGTSKYLGKSTIRHHVIVDTDDHNVDCGISLRANAHQVSIASDSVDAVLLPHTLDVDMAPHQVLREVDRILVPEGKVVVIGFNPWSSWGMRHMFNLWSSKNPWNLRFISPFRLKDWLTLLGFEIETVKTFFHRPPLMHPLAVRKLQFMDRLGNNIWPAFGGIYILVANKKVSTMTPIRPRWYLRRRSRVSPGFIETRNNDC